ncbi:lysine--tRNA ligase [Buchnera aphidicola]|uniref:lysine--tRNA ligase n=1 Tax=Buchnera aphidicola TaxID=9 RepID=UPI0034641097
MLCKKNNHHKNIINPEHEYEIRKKKLIEMEKQGFNFPNTFKINTNITDINKKYSRFDNTELLKKKKFFNVSGRIIKKRHMGKATFLVIQDMLETIQIYVTEKKISYDFYRNTFKKWDIGDIIFTTGTIFKTKTGQLSIYCSEINILSKALQPFPNKFHGLLNQDIKYRKRYLDLLSNVNVMKIFYKRSKILSIIRNFMNKNNFLEVETPMMQHIPGGASARPFITHHNSLDLKMYLRISPELYLKRLIIGGFSKIYEMNKNFRNEGISYKHNPEFTMMELYITYADYKDLMIFIKELLQHIVYQTTGNYILNYQNNEFDLKKPFKILTIKDAILHYNPKIKHSDLLNISEVQKLLYHHNIPIKKNWSLEKMIIKIFEHTTENKIIEPTFITEYPTETSPLARKNDFNKNLVDRFEFFIGGLEIGNGFSELNNPIEQKERFLKQKKLNQMNQKKEPYDKEYILAMEYGMPPTAGLGIGIDRLIMVLTNQKNIRNVILFPTLRPIK